MKTDLYRHYDTDGNLLYIGISLSTVQRLSQHRNKSGWYDRVKRVEIEKFSSREDALEAEKKAIEKENPIFNIQHNMGFAPVPVTGYNGMSFSGKRSDGECPDWADPGKWRAKQDEYEKFVRGGL